MSKLFFDPILNKLTKHPTETGVVKSVNNIKPNASGNVDVNTEDDFCIVINGTHTPKVFFDLFIYKFNEGLGFEKRGRIMSSGIGNNGPFLILDPNDPALQSNGKCTIFPDLFENNGNQIQYLYLGGCNYHAWRSSGSDTYFLEFFPNFTTNVLEINEAFKITSGSVFVMQNIFDLDENGVSHESIKLSLRPTTLLCNKYCNETKNNYITSVNGLVPDENGNLILPLGMDGYTEIPEWENVMTYMFEKGPGIYLCKPFATYTGLPEEPGFETKRNNWYINTFITYKRGEAPVVPEPDWGERFAYGDFLLEMNEILPNGYKALASFRRLAYSNFSIAEHNLPWQKLQGSSEEILIPEEEYPFEYMFLFMYKNGPGRYRYVSSDIPNDIPIVPKYEGSLNSLVFDYNTYQSQTQMGYSFIQNEFICRLLYEQAASDFQLWRGVGSGSTHIKWSQILDSNGFPMVEKTNIHITKDMLPTELYDFVKYHFRDCRKEITGELSCQGAEKFLKIENASAGQAVGDGCEKINSFYEFAKLNMGITDKDVICIPLNGMRYEACLDANGYCQLKLHIEKSTTENGILSIAFCNAAFGSTLIYNTLFMPAFGGNPQIAMPILTLETSQMWDIAMAGTAAARKNVVVELSPMSFTTSSLRSTLIAQMNEGETEVEGEITGGTVGGAEPFWNYGEDPVDNVTVSLGYNPNNTLPLILNGAYFKITKNKLGLYSIDIKPTTHHTQAAPYIMGTTYSIMDFKGVINGNNVNAVFVKWDVTSVNFMQFFNAYHKDDPTV